MTGRTNASAGGGTGYNYNLTVISSSTRPSTPSEGTVWITASGNVGAWSISPVPPGTAQNGDIWIKQAGNTIAEITDNVSAYISAVYIRTNGEWVFVSAELYANAMWIPLTGGDVLFIAGVTIPMYERKQTAASIVLDSDGYTLTCQDASSSATVSADIGTVNKVDLTEYSTVTVKLRNVSLAGQGKIYAYILSTRTDNTNGPAYAITYDGNTPVASAQLTNAADTQISLSVDSLTGEYYVQVIALVSNNFGYNNGATGTAICTITELSLS